MGAILEEKAPLAMSGCAPGVNGVLGRGEMLVCGHRSAHKPVHRGNMLTCVSAGPVEITLTSPETLIAPADCPNSVTLSGSPPKASMFS